MSQQSLLKRVRQHVFLLALVIPPVLPDLPFVSYHHLVGENVPTNTISLMDYLEGATSSK